VEEIYFVLRKLIVAEHIIQVEVAVDLDGAHFGGAAWDRDWENT
jgi:hypothetical protein